MILDVILIYLLLGAIGAKVLFIWFRTNAFVEYLSFFHLGYSIGINDYQDATVNDPGMSYPTFLVTNYNSFMTRLLSCAKCLSVQVAIVLNIILFIVISIYITGLIWLLFPFSVLITSYTSLLMYFTLVSLMKRE